MSVVEDVRQVPQDFVAPELKSVEARLTALENEVRTGFAGVKAALARLENQIGLAQRVEALQRAAEPGGRPAAANEQQH